MNLALISILFWNFDILAYLLLDAIAVVVAEA